MKNIKCMHDFQHRKTGHTTIRNDSTVINEVSKQIRLKEETNTRMLNRCDRSNFTIKQFLENAINAYCDSFEEMEKSIEELINDNAQI